MHTGSGKAVRKPGFPRADVHGKEGQIFLCSGKPMTVIKTMPHPPVSLLAMIYMIAMQAGRGSLSWGNLV